MDSNDAVGGIRRGTSVAPAKYQVAYRESAESPSSKGRSESDRNRPNRFSKPVLYPLGYEGEGRVVLGRG